MAYTVHIRQPQPQQPDVLTLHIPMLCGATGGSSISLRHFDEQKEHVASLPLCAECREIAQHDV